MKEQATQNYFESAAAVIAGMKNQARQIVDLSAVLIHCLKNGNKILTCGNGGSAAEALHLAEELTGKYNKNRCALPGLCLNADVTALTCIANDWDFGEVFSRQVEAFGKAGDVLVGFTTSGNSENVVRALNTARKMGIITVGLLGKDGGKARDLCDYPLIVSSPRTSHAQEAHQVILHMLLELIDAEFVNQSSR